eukprot:CAMPEP_0170976496 /NCGR_PEP_ID=MMETSP0735-20130129/48725_1 /TAXON_ID=186038 /ORGANISM="Fragilariopsis kerguelensis, Strain L26-C5" /LENGTH=815 /DNA_ID=CAMNT_0011398401 /DNA_START=348 /DNA_END=2792 /DNA_ORIENTATION=+
MPVTTTTSISKKKDQPSPRLHHRRQQRQRWQNPFIAQQQRNQQRTRLYSDSRNDDDNGIMDDDDSTNNTTSTSSSLFWPNLNTPRRRAKSNAKRRPHTNTDSTNINGDSKVKEAAVSNQQSQNQEQQEQHPIDFYDELFDSIVKIYATHNRVPNYSMPWQYQHPYTSTSSGFVIDGRRILTNAHSVEYAGQVLVRKRGSSKKYYATIQIVANECDLALLTVEDDSFWYDITDSTDTDELDQEDYDYDDDDEEELDKEEEDDENEEVNDEDDDKDDDDKEDEYDDEANKEDNEDDNYADTDTDTNSEQMIIQPLVFGRLPELQDEVEVLGYPTGGDSLSVTKGVVSRIEGTEYAQCSGSHLLAIQIDAAINGGNSGGPVVDATTGQVVGVAFQSLTEAENIGYVVPITVVLHFLEDIRRNHHEYYSGVTALGMKYARLENTAMRSYLKLPKEQETSQSKKKNRRTKNTKKKNQRPTTSKVGQQPSDSKTTTGTIETSTNSTNHVTNGNGGVMVRSCAPTAPAKHILQTNDVILAVDAIPIASDGNIPFRRNGKERVSFASYIQTKFSTDTIQLTIWRNEKNRDHDNVLPPQEPPQEQLAEHPHQSQPHQIVVDVPLCVSKNLVPSHWNNQSPPYLIVGGLVFSVLSVPYLEENDAWTNYVSDSISYLMNKIYEPLQHPDDQVVILINVLAHPSTLGYDNLYDLHLTSCNNIKVRSLPQLQQLIAEIEQQKCTGIDVNDDVDYLKLEFGSLNGGSDDNHNVVTTESSSSEGGGGTVVILESTSLEETTQEVCDEHSIQKPYYFPPSSSRQTEKNNTT